MDSQRKVMIVEDDPLLSIVEEKLVTKLGYDVVGKTKTGEDTLDNIHELNPDILLIDVQLAGVLSGIETVRKLRDQHFDLPVIFLSGEKEASVLKSAENINYIDFLLKPVTSDELSVPLQKACEQLLIHAQTAA